jgi:hypothetical protein
MVLPDDCRRLASLLTHAQLAELVVELHARVVQLEAQSERWPMSAQDIYQRVLSDLDARLSETEAERNTRTPVT